MHQVPATFSKPLSEPKLCLAAIADPYSEARANTSTELDSHPDAATRNASIHVKFELYMPASHFDDVAHNLQWSG